MSFGARIELRQSQSLVMTPQLQQAIKLLQMSNMDLVDYVAQEIERNPLLEEGAPEPAVAPPEPPAEAAPAPADTAAELSEDRLGRAEETFDTGLENLYADTARADVAPGDAGGHWGTTGSTGGSFEGGGMDFEAMLTREQTLREHMLEQLGCTALGPADRLIAADLIEHLDEAGYLRADPGAVAARLGATDEAVERALSVIQGFEPAGIAARTLSECLALQLADIDRLDPAMRVLVDNLELLAKAETAKLQKLCGVDAEDLSDMIGEIRALHPKPGIQFGHEIAQTVQPDVYVRRNDLGGWAVDLNADTLPKVLVNTRYSAQVSGDGAVKAYLSECMQTANWLVKSLDQRARTILKVSSEIVRQQDGFLAYGVSALRPLNLKTVAEAIDMHESTVSRVTSNKYISTERGVFELKFFFTAAIGATDGGEAFSAESVRHRIRQMIGDERPDAILSDDKIVQLLRDGGIEIARRTVAKYRESMNIPSSVQRRRRKVALA